MDGKAGSRVKRYFPTEGTWWPASVRQFNTTALDRAVLLPAYQLQQYRKPHLRCMASTAACIQLRSTAYGAASTSAVAYCAPWYDRASRREDLQGCGAVGDGHVVQVDNQPGSHAYDDHASRWMKTYQITRTAVM